MLRLHKEGIIVSDIVIEIPSDIARALKIPDREVIPVLRKELAVQLYAQQFLSFGKARQLAQLSKWEFAEMLGRHGIARHYDGQSLQEDLEFAYEEFGEKGK
jgi:predicted HTH domain antitoxin